MDIRKVKLRRTENYLELVPLFIRAKLTNADEIPQGFLYGYAAEGEKGQLLGGVTLVESEGSYAIHALEVDSEARGYGLGRNLLCKAMVDFQNMKAEEVFVAARVTSFFRAYGFEGIETSEKPELFHQLERCAYEKHTGLTLMRKEISDQRILFIDSCVSTHRSRTRQLCNAWLRRFMKEHPGMVMDMVVLDQTVMQPLDLEALEHRDDLVRIKDWDDPIFKYARQFRRADYILVGAPYWDCSFPSILKVYIENIVVEDFTFQATEKGYEGLCSCKELIYITTSGGPIGELDLGYDYIRGVGGMLGIFEYREYRAEGLDLQGADEEQIMERALREINE